MSRARPTFNENWYETIYIYVCSVCDDRYDEEQDAKTCCPVCSNCGDSWDYCGGSCEWCAECGDECCVNSPGGEVSCYFAEEE